MSGSLLRVELASHIRRSLWRGEWMERMQFFSSQSIACLGLHFKSLQCYIRWLGWLVFVGCLRARLVCLADPIGRDDDYSGRFASYLAP